MMKAMLLKKISAIGKNRTPLEMAEFPHPVAGEKEILVAVSTCAVCHTELDEIEGRTPPPRFPVIPGHQVVGTVVENGTHAHRFKQGCRVGIAWIFSACGACPLCRDGKENLCQSFLATGRDAHGGYAQFMTVHEDFAYPIPGLFSDSQAAPLLCAGAIGYRSLTLTALKNGQNIGLTGFGASAHLVLKMIQHTYSGVNVFVFARNEKERSFAVQLGAVWAGDIGDPSPVKLDAVIDTTPAWKPVVEALQNLQSGGRLVINAIRKEKHDKHYLLNVDYPAHLWMEKEIKSVANVTRRDVRNFLQLAAEIPITPEVQEYSLEDANTALVELKHRTIRGAKVLKIG